MRRPVEFDGYSPVLEAMAPYGPYRAVVSRIVDGDTLYALASPGFDSYCYVVIRMRGINAPELNTGDNRAAGAASRDHLAQLIPAGTAVVLATERDVTTFGRYVAYVYAIGADGQPYEVGAQMVADGYAVPMAG